MTGISFYYNQILVPVFSFITMTSIIGPLHKKPLGYKSVFLNLGAVSHIFLKCVITTLKNSDILRVSVNNNKIKPQDSL